MCFELKSCIKGVQRAGETSSGARSGRATGSWSKSALRPLACEVLFLWPRRTGKAREHHEPALASESRGGCLGWRGRGELHAGASGGADCLLLAWLDGGTWMYYPVNVLNLHWTERRELRLQHLNRTPDELYDVFYRHGEPVPGHLLKDSILDLFY